MAELKNIRIAVSGLYDYAFEELPSLRIALPGKGAPDWVEEKRLYKVYRPAPVLAAACSKFANLPLTHHHPKSPVDGVNFRELAIGWTGEHPEVDYVAEADEIGIKSTCVLYDEEALNAYERGEVQLSPGYIAVFEWQKGKTPSGEEYDIVMKEITDVNHLALLPAGRGGEFAAVLDGAAGICHRGQFDEYKDQVSVFTLVRNKLTDGAPKGNDNAAKDHVKKEEDVAAKKRAFGTEYKGFKGVDAIKKLLQEKQGFIQNAYTRNDIGNIDVVYGEIVDEKKLKGYGLKKIFAKHPEITPEIMDEIINKGIKENTYNGCNLIYKDYILGINDGWYEGKDRKRVTTDNWIVTSFKTKEEKVNDTIASAATFTPDTSRPGNLLIDEIIICIPSKIKSIFDLVKGSVFDRTKAGMTI